MLTTFTPNVSYLVHVGHNKLEFVRCLFLTSSEMNVIHIKCNISYLVFGFAYKMV
jgi:hypothetical protein